MKFIPFSIIGCAGTSLAEIPEQLHSSHSIGAAKVQLAYDVFKQQFQTVIQPTRLPINGFDLPLGPILHGDDARFPWDESIRYENPTEYQDQYGNRHELTPEQETYVDPILGTFDLKWENGKLVSMTNLLTKLTKTFNDDGTIKSIQRADGQVMTFSYKQSKIESIDFAQGSRLKFNRTDDSSTEQLVLSRSGKKDKLLQTHEYRSDKLSAISWGEDHNLSLGYKNGLQIKQSDKTCIDISENTLKLGSEQYAFTHKQTSDGQQTIIANEATGEITLKHKDGFISAIIDRLTRILIGFTRHRQLSSFLECTASNVLATLSERPRNTSRYNFNTRPAYRISSSNLIPPTPKQGVPGNTLPEDRQEIEYDETYCLPKQANNYGKIFDMAYQDIQSPGTYIKNISCDNTVRYEVYEQGRLRATLSAEGRLTYMEYDADSKTIFSFAEKFTLPADETVAAILALCESKKAEGIKTVYQLDHNKHIKSESINDNQLSTTKTNHFGQTKKHTGKLSFENEFDAIARQTLHTAAGHETKTDYTHALCKVTQPTGEQHSLTTSAAGRIEAETHDACYIENVLNAAGQLNAIQTSADGLTVTQTHYENGRGKPEVLLDPSGLLIVHEYNARNQLIATYFADVSGCASFAKQQLIEHAKANTKSKRQLVRNPKGQIVYEIDVDGYVTHFKYDKRGNEIIRTRFDKAVSEPLAKHTLDSLVKEFTDDAPGRHHYSFYDNDDLLIGEIDAFGAAKRYVYDGVPRLTKTIGFSEKAIDKPSKYMSHADALQKFNNVKRTPEHDRETRKIHNEYNQLAYVIDPEGYVTEYVYTANQITGKRSYFEPLQSISDDTTASEIAGTLEKNLPLYDEIKYKRDSLNRIIEEQHPNGLVIQTEYLADTNKPVSIAIRDLHDREGHKLKRTLFHYERGVLVQKLDPKTVHKLGLDEVDYKAIDWESHKITEMGERYLTNGFKQTYKTFDAMKNPSWDFYDESGWHCCHIDSRGVVTLYEYEAMHDKPKRKIILCNQIQLSYERMAELDNCQGHFGLIEDKTEFAVLKDFDSIWVMSYSNSDKLESTIDPENRSHTLERNAHNEVEREATELTAGGAKRVEETHTNIDECRLTHTVTEGDQSVTTHSIHNAFGEEEVMIDGNGHKWKFTLDRRGNITCITRPKGSKIHQVWDHHKRLLKKSFPTLSEADLKQIVWAEQHEYDDVENIEKIIDAINRTAKIVRNVHNEVIANTSKTGIQTNTRRNRQGLMRSETTVADGAKLIRSAKHDPLGYEKESTSVSGVENRITDYDGPLPSKFSSQAAGGAAIETSLTHDHLAKILSRIRRGGSLSERTGYENNRAGQRDAVIQGHGSTDGLTQRTNTPKDALGRARSQARSGPTTGTRNLAAHELKELYSYDVFSAVSAKAQVAGDKRRNQVIKKDGNGNAILKRMPNDASHHYVYDKLNRLRFSINAEGEVIEWRYDETNDHPIEKRVHDKVIAISKGFEDLSWKERLRELERKFSDASRETYELTEFAYTDQRELAYTLHEGQLRYQKLDKHDKPALTKVFDRNFAGITLESVLKEFGEQGCQNELGRLTQEFRDQKGQIRFKIDGEGYVTEYQYDERFSNKVTAVIKYDQPLSGYGAHSFDRDALFIQLKDLSKQSPLSARISQYYYNEFGNEQFSVDEYGRIKHTEYNELNYKENEATILKTLTRENRLYDLDEIKKLYSNFVGALEPQDRAKKLELHGALSQVKFIRDSLQRIKAKVLNAHCEQPRTISYGLDCFNNIIETIEHSKTTEHHFDHFLRKYKTVLINVPCVVINDNLECSGKVEQAEQQLAQLQLVHQGLMSIEHKSEFFDNDATKSESFADNIKEAKREISFRINNLSRILAKTKKDIVIDDPSIMLEELLPSSGVGELNPTAAQDLEARTVWLPHDRKFCEIDAAGFGAITIYTRFNKPLYHIARDGRISFYEYNSLHEEEAWHGFETLLPKSTLDNFIKRIKAANDAQNNEALLALHAEIREACAKLRRSERDRFLLHQRDNRGIVVDTKQPADLYGWLSPEDHEAHHMAYESLTKVINAHGENEHSHKALKEYDPEKPYSDENQEVGDPIDTRSVKFVRPHALLSISDTGYLTLTRYHGNGEPEMIWTLATHVKDFKASFAIENKAVLLNFNYEQVTALFQAHKSEEDSLTEHVYGAHKRVIRDIIHNAKYYDWEHADGETFKPETSEIVFKESQSLSTEYAYQDVPGTPFTWCKVERSDGEIYYELMHGEDIIATVGPKVGPYSGEEADDTMHWPGEINLPNPHGQAAYHVEFDDCEFRDDYPAINMNFMKSTDGMAQLLEFPSWVTAKLRQTMTAYSRDGLKTAVQNPEGGVSRTAFNKIRAKVRDWSYRHRLLSRESAERLLTKTELNTIKSRDDMALLLSEQRHKVDRVGRLQRTYERVTGKLIQALIAKAAAEGKKTRDAIPQYDPERGCAEILEDVAKAYAELFDKNRTELGLSEGDYTLHQGHDHNTFGEIVADIMQRIDCDKETGEISLQEDRFNHKVFGRNAFAYGDTNAKGQAVINVPDNHKEAGLTIWKLKERLKAQSAEQIGEYLQQHREDAKTGISELNVDARRRDGHGNVTREVGSEFEAESLDNSCLINSVLDITRNRISWPTNRGNNYAVSIRLVKRPGADADTIDVKAKFEQQGSQAFYVADISDLPDGNYDYHIVYQAITPDVNSDHNSEVENEPLNNDARKVTPKLQLKGSFSKQENCFDLVEPRTLRYQYCGEDAALALSIKVKGKDEPQILYANERSTHGLAYFNLNVEYCEIDSLEVLTDKAVKAQHMTGQQYTVELQTHYIYSKGKAKAEAKLLKGTRLDTDDRNGPTLYQYPIPVDCDAVCLELHNGGVDWATPERYDVTRVSEDFKVYCSKDGLLTTDKPVTSNAVLNNFFKYINWGEDAGQRYRLALVAKKNGQKFVLGYQGLSDKCEIDPGNENKYKQMHDCGLIRQFYPNDNYVNLKTNAPRVALYQKGVFIKLLEVESCPGDMARINLKELEGCNNDNDIKLNGFTFVPVNEESLSIGSFPSDGLPKSAPTLSSLKCREVVLSQFQMSGNNPGYAFDKPLLQIEGAKLLPGNVRLHCDTNGYFDNDYDADKGKKSEHPGGDWFVYLGLFQVYASLFGGHKDQSWLSPIYPRVPDPAHNGKYRVELQSDDGHWHYFQPSKKWRKGSDSKGNRLDTYPRSSFHLLEDLPTELARLEVILIVNGEEHIVPANQINIGPTTASFPLCDRDGKLLPLGQYRYKIRGFDSDDQQIGLNGEKASAIPACYTGVFERREGNHGVLSNPVSTENKRYRSTVDRQFNHANNCVEFILNGVKTSFEFYHDNQVHRVHAPEELRIAESGSGQGHVAQDVYRHESERSLRPSTEPHPEFPDNVRLVRFEPVTTHFNGIMGDNIGHEDPNGQQHYQKNNAKGIRIEFSDSRGQLHKLVVNGVGALLEAYSLKGEDLVLELKRKLDLNNQPIEVESKNANGGARVVRSINDSFGDLQATREGDRITQATLQCNQAISATLDRHGIWQVELKDPTTGKPLSSFPEHGFDIHLWFRDLVNRLSVAFDPSGVATVSIYGDEADGPSNYSKQTEIKQERELNDAHGEGVPGQHLKFKLNGREDVLQVSDVIQDRHYYMGVDENHREISRLMLDGLGTVLQDLKVTLDNSGNVLVLIDKDRVLERYLNKQGHAGRVKAYIWAEEEGEFKWIKDDSWSEENGYGQVTAARLLVDDEGHMAIRPGESQRFIYEEGNLKYQMLYLTKSEAEDAPVLKTALDYVGGSVLKGVEKLFQARTRGEISTKDLSAEQLNAANIHYEDSGAVKAIEPQETKFQPYGWDTKSTVETGTSNPGIHYSHEAGLLVTSTHYTEVDKGKSFSMSCKDTVRAELPNKLPSQVSRVRRRSSTVVDDMNIDYRFLGTSRGVIPSSTHVSNKHGDAESKQELDSNSNQIGARGPTATGRQIMRNADVSYDGATLQEWGAEEGDNKTFYSHERKCFGYFVSRDGKYRFQSLEGFEGISRDDVPRERMETHAVEQGDTIQKIISSLNFNPKVADEVLLENGLDPNQYRNSPLPVGMRLRIPQYIEVNTAGFFKIDPLQTPEEIISQIFPQVPRYYEKESMHLSRRRNLQYLMLAVTAVSAIASMGTASFFTSVLAKSMFAAVNAGVTDAASQTIAKHAHMIDHYDRNQTFKSMLSAGLTAGINEHMESYFKDNPLLQAPKDGSPEAKALVAAKQKIITSTVQSMTHSISQYAASGFRKHLDVRGMLSNAAVTAFAGALDLHSDVEKGDDHFSFGEIMHQFGKTGLQAGISHAIDSDNNVLQEAVHLLVTNMSQMYQEHHKHASELEHNSSAQGKPAAHEPIQSKHAAERVSIEAENTSMGGGAHPAYDADIVKGEMTPIDWGADSYGVHDGEMTPFAFRERSLSERAAINLSKHPWVASLVSSRAWQVASKGLSYLGNAVTPFNKRIEATVLPPLAGPAEVMAGLGEMAVGAAASSTGLPGAVVGRAAMVQGGDYVIAGMRNTWSYMSGSGEYQETFLQQGLQHFMSKEEAIGAELLFSLAAGGGSIAGRVASRSQSVGRHMQSLFGRGNSQRLNTPMSIGQATGDYAPREVLQLTVGDSASSSVRSGFNLAAPNSGARAELSRIYGNNPIGDYDYYCTEEAFNIRNAAGNQGKVVIFSHKDALWKDKYDIGMLSENIHIPTTGGNEPFTYHSVYTDGKFIYDPLVGSQPIPQSQYISMLRELNPNGISWRIYNNKSLNMQVQGNAPELLRRGF
jgi:YD repeat-containing protein